MDMRLKESGLLKGGKINIKLLREKLEEAEHDTEATMLQRCRYPEFRERGKEMEAIALEAVQRLPYRGDGREIAVGGRKDMSISVPDENSLLTQARRGRALEIGSASEKPWMPYLVAAYMAQGLDPKLAYEDVGILKQLIPEIAEARKTQKAEGNRMLEHEPESWVRLKQLEQSRDLSSKEAERN